MKNIRIRTRDAAYQKLEVLSTNRNKRYKYYEFLVEGVRNINEARKNGWEFSSLIFDPAADLSDWAKDTIKHTKTDVNIELSGSLMAELSEKEDTSELMAVIKMRRDDTDQIKIRTGAPLIAIFDRPSNKGNLGTIIRTLDSLGADGLILTGHGVDLYDREVVGATMGSIFALPAVRIPKHSDLLRYMDELRVKYGDLQVIGTTAHAEKAVWEPDLTKPTIFMIGCETDGLSEGLRAYCTDMVTIPMAENCAATSFNVACAATVMFYEATRQRAAL
ncbi:MAG: rRNA methyltransferase [Clostridia bacterium]|nr:rRNA methyltransferase [Clostridia bacterium]